MLDQAQCKLVQPAWVLKPQQVLAQTDLSLCKAKFFLLTHWAFCWKTASIAELLPSVWKIYTRFHDTSNHLKQSKFVLSDSITPSHDYWSTIHHYLLCLQVSARQIATEARLVVYSMGAVGLAFPKMGFIVPIRLGQNGTIIEKWAMYVHVMCVYFVLKNVNTWKIAHRFPTYLAGLSWHLR